MATWYVSPTGLASNTGSVTSPWDLQTALGQPASVVAGDTINLRGGTYAGKFISSLRGTAANPITVQSSPGEWAKIDVGTGGMALRVGGQYTYFRDFEVMSSDPDHLSAQAGSFPSDVSSGWAVDTDQTNAPNGANCKLINLIIHDTGGNGVGCWALAANFEVYACIIYYNGWLSTVDGTHAHGVYVQQLDSGASKFLTNNIHFYSYSHNIHCYGTEIMWNFILDGITSVLAGKLGSFSSRNYLVGTGSLSHHARVTNCYGYDNGLSPAVEEFNWGYADFGGGFDDFVQTGCYMATGTARIQQPFTNFNISGNTFIDLNTFFTQSTYPSNTWINTGRPTTGKAIFVRPNIYESGRGNLTIFNWDKSATVAVDVSATGLLAGQTYEIRDAMNWFAGPIATGIYAPPNVTVPMTGLTMAPINSNAFTTPSHPAPTFGVFVIRRISAASMVPLSASMTALSAI